MRTNFKTGDIVTLKSGGPEMTVSEIIHSVHKGEYEVECIYYNKEKNEYKTLMFKPQILIAI